MQALGEDSEGAQSPYSFNGMKIKTIQQYGSPCGNKRVQGCDHVVWHVSWQHTTESEDEKGLTEN